MGCDDVSLFASSYILNRVSVRASGRAHFHKMPMKKWFIFVKIFAAWDYIYHKILGFPVAEDEEEKGDE